MHSEMFHVEHRRDPTRFDLFHVKQWFVASAFDSLRPVSRETLPDAIVFLHIDQKSGSTSASGRRSVSSHTSLCVPSRSSTPPQPTPWLTSMGRSPT